MPSVSPVFFFFFFFFATTVHPTVSQCPPHRSPPHIVATKEEAQLKVLVPNIIPGSLRQFVDCSDPSNVRGFCIDVFERALSILSPPNLSSTTIHYTCFNFTPIPSANNYTPNYDDMVRAVANGSYDVVVGDVTIDAQREFEVDFTHEYMESGVVIIAKVVNDGVGSEWMFFLSPFSWRMWCVVAGSFAFTGFLIWLVERQNHMEFTQGSFPSRFYKIFWFIMEALILLERASIKSTTAQLVMVAWVFVVLLLSSSYTAGLSSILTVSNLAPATSGILELKNSNGTIAYRKGSVTRDYLTNRFGINESRLEAVRATHDFVSNITHNHVIAIVDELPYANLILQNLSSCDFAISGTPLTSEGFGFGFRRDLGLQWEKNFSIALMNLTESGCLQQLQISHGMSETSGNCSSNSNSQKVSWKSSLSLSVPLILISLLCVILSYIRRCRQPSTNLTFTVTTDPSILLAHHERTPRLGNRHLELSIFSQP